MCLTEKPADECVGSSRQVPAGIASVEEDGSVVVISKGLL